MSGKIGALTNEVIDEAAAGPEQLVCVDFDGVLHAHHQSDGFTASDVIREPPLDGAIEWLRRLARDDRIDVAVYSARSSDDGAIEAMQDWLVDQGLNSDDLARINFPESKPPANVFVDDRGVNFDGENYPSIDELAEFEAWWE